MSTPATLPTATQTLEALRHFMPVAHQEAALDVGRVGLILVDPVVGFTTRGALSDPASMQPMVDRVDALCRELLDALGARLSVFVFRDRHEPDQIEPPYPPHCQAGTGEEELDPKLRWLEDRDEVTILDKDCINGMIGALEESETEGRHELWRHHFVEWMSQTHVDQLLVVGDCTDICVLDFVVAVLSARNHGMFGHQRAEMPVSVFAPACATFHLPDPVSLGLPETARHERDLCHHAALYFMQARGAVICDRVRL